MQKASQNQEEASTTHQSDLRPKRTSGGRQEPQRWEQAPNSGSQQRSSRVYILWQTEKPERHDRVKGMTPRHPAHREPTQRVALSMPFMHAKPKMRSTPPGRGPWGQNQQEPSKRTGPKCSYRKKRTPQSHGRQKRNSGGWREPQRQAPSVGSQQKSRAEYTPQQTEEPGAAGDAALGAGAEHIQIRDRATSEQNHAKQKERENTPRHPAHRERMRRRTDQFRSAGNGHGQQHARPRQQKNRNGGEGPLKRAPWKRKLSNTKEMANSTKKAAVETQRLKGLEPCTTVTCPFHLRTVPNKALKSRILPEFNIAGHLDNGAHSRRLLVSQNRVGPGKL